MNLRSSALSFLRFLRALLSAKASGGAVITGLSRRQFIQLTAAGLGVAALPGPVVPADGIAGVVGFPGQRVDALTLEALYAVKDELLKAMHGNFVAILHPKQFEDLKSSLSAEPKSIMGVPVIDARTTDLSGLFGGVTKYA